MSKYRIKLSDSYWRGLRKDSDFRKYRIEKKGWILWHNVDSNGDPFHFEHFSHGNDYCFYETEEEAQEAIQKWENKKARLANRRRPDTIVSEITVGTK